MGDRNRAPLGGGRRQALPLIAPLWGEFEAVRRMSMCRSRPDPAGSYWLIALLMYITQTGTHAFTNEGDTPFKHCARLALLTEHAAATFFYCTDCTETR